MLLKIQLKMVKKIKIRVKLWFVFLGWCISDIRENYYDMKTRYLLETDPELLELQSFVKELIKKENKYGLYPVFIDENKDVVNIHNMPVYLSDTILDLATVENKAGLPLPSLMKEAWDYPVIDYNSGEYI